MKIFLLFILFLFFTACDRNCDETSTQVHLRYLSKNNGQDLVFGTPPVYDFTKIKLFAAYPEKRFFTIIKKNMGNNIPVLAFQLPELKTNYLYIEYNGQLTDSLVLDMTYPQSGHCNTSFLQNITSAKDSIVKSGTGTWLIYQ